MLQSLCLALLSGLAKGDRDTAPAYAEQAPDLRQPRAVLGRQSAAGAQHLAYHIALHGELGR
jgi:hypothetical protein